MRPIDQTIAALKALALLLEQEPFLSDIEREAIIHAVFKAISKSKSTGRKRVGPVARGVIGDELPARTAAG